MTLMRLAVLLLAVGAVSAEEAGQVRGVVVDARGGEPLARVQVQLQPAAVRTLTDENGRFSLPAVPPGDYELHVSTVGYRLLKRPFALAAGEIKDFEVVLNQDNLRQTDSIEVTAGPFELARNDSPSEMTLAGVEAKNLASVLADDPLRAVQSLPGVASNDDFDSRFSLRGAGYTRVGLYLDDVLLHAPFHMVAGETATGSVTALNGDTIDSISLHSGAYPARYADRTGGALAASTREGTRMGRSVRVTASASNAGLVAEGPLGRRGSWLAATRKSYLQYIIRRTTSDSDPSFAFGILDGQGKLAYDLTGRHHVSLGLSDGYSDLDRTASRSTLGLNALMTTGYHLSLANLSWRYTPGERLLVSNRAVFMRERFTNKNRDWLALESGHYGEWIWQSQATWVQTPRATLEGGWSARRIRDNGFENRYQFNPTAVRRLEDHAGHGWRLGGYLEQTWSSSGGRIRGAAGARWDRHSVNGIQAVSPHVSGRAATFGWAGGSTCNTPSCAGFSRPPAGAGCSRSDPTTWWRLSSSASDRAPGSAPNSMTGRTGTCCSGRSTSPA